MSDLHAEARALYALPLAEFTAARNDRARQVRATGGRDLAAAVKALPKPSVSAWTVNMLVRHRPTALREVLTTGAELRSAQDAGDRWSRELDRRRRHTLAVATRAAEELAGELGQKVSAGVSEEVEATLRAAMADAQAATAVAAGLLVRPLTATGLQPVDLTGAVAVPVTASPADAPDADRAADAYHGDAPLHAVPERGPRRPPPVREARDREDREARRRRARTEAAARARARARERAQQEVDRAREVMDRAAAGLHAAEERLQDLRASALQVSAELDELRRRVAESEAEADRLSDEVAAAEEVRDAADEAQLEAEADVETAQEALRALEADD